MMVAQGVFLTETVPGLSIKIKERYSMEVTQGKKPRFCSHQWMVFVMEKNIFKKKRMIFWV